MICSGSSVGTLTAGAETNTTFLRQGPLLGPLFVSDPPAESVLAAVKGDADHGTDQRGQPNRGGHRMRLG